MYYLIDAGSSSIKLYIYDNGELTELEKKTYKLFVSSKTSTFSLLEEDRKIIISIFLYFKKKYGLSRKNTKIFATGHFRKINEKNEFISYFYSRTGMFFNIISQELELFYLEKKFLDYSKILKSILVFNIGNESTEIISFNNGDVIERVKIDWGVNWVKEIFRNINIENNADLLNEVVKRVKKELPCKTIDSPITFYTGGELSFMRRMNYPLVDNCYFNDKQHPQMISYEKYELYNKKLFSSFTIKDFHEIMPENPKWMDGARACSAIAQAICSVCQSKTIIPSDLNLIDGVVAQEAQAVVLCGSFNRHLKQISILSQRLKEKGIQVLSPSNTEVTGDLNGFILFKNDDVINNCAWSIETKHLDAIRKCDIVIICNFDNYLGASTAFEIGVALENGKKVVFVEKNEVAKNFDGPFEIGLLDM